MADQQFDNTNRGVLFINNRKKTPRHPGFTGKINVGGVEYWLSGWSNVIKSGPRAGEKMLSLAVGDPVEGYAPEHKSSSGPKSPPDMFMDDSDDIPF